MKKPELLAPAGSFEKAKIAFLYGADAIYCGTSKFSLRSRAEMDFTSLIQTINYAHSINKKVYVAMNIYAEDSSYEEMKEEVKNLDKIGVDAIILSDGGVLELVKEYAPNTEIHISTQANVISYHSSKFWYNNGAKRIILGRELNKKDILEIQKNKPNDLAIEIFIHGAICFSYSGRCFLSNFLAERNANLGDCAQSCRWEYNVYVEENKKPGALMPVVDDPTGTFIFSSKDLCLIKELPEIIDMGIDSLKIEGRLKTEYYLATVINSYRHAIDDYFQNKSAYNYEIYLNELNKTKTRGLTTLYFNDKSNKDIQDYSGLQTNTNYEFGAKVIDISNDFITLEIRNKLQIGDILEIILPNSITPFGFTLNNLYDEQTNEPISEINPGKQGQKVKIKPIKNIEIKQNYIIRRKK